MIINRYTLCIILKIIPMLRTSDVIFFFFNVIPLYSDCHNSDLLFCLFWNHKIHKKIDLLKKTIGIYYVYVQFNAYF